MPLPFFLIAGAILAGSTGIGAGVAGACEMADASKSMKEAQKRDERNLQRLKKDESKTSSSMDRLGKQELETLSGFKEFSNLFERIKNKPKFADITIDGLKLPEYNHKEMEKISVGASALVGGLGGALLGTAGGFAASGATTAAVMALGTASTGTAISTLSGAAATNATLAALGGGSIAAGGGGIALGTTVLGAATAGVGLLVGGVIFCIAGSSVSKKADTCVNQVNENEKKINRICDYLNRLNDVCNDYYRVFVRVNNVYINELAKMRLMIFRRAGLVGNVNWHDLSDEEKLCVQNTVMLVGVLFNMCKVKLVIPATRKDDLNSINYIDIGKARRDGEACLKHFEAA